METFSALLALCAGNSPVKGEFPSQRPVTRSFSVYFDLHLNKRLSKQPRRRWLETPSISLWRQCNMSIKLFLFINSYRWLPRTCTQTPTCMHLMFPIKQGFPAIYGLSRGYTSLNDIGMVIGYQYNSPTNRRQGGRQQYLYTEYNANHHPMTYVCYFQRAPNTVGQRKKVTAVTFFRCPTVPKINSVFAKIDTFNTCCFSAVRPRGLSVNMSAVN